MDNKVYKRLMIAGLLPWRNDVLKSNRNYLTEEQRLLRDGWKYVNIAKVLYGHYCGWRMLYKVVDESPRDLPGHLAMHGVFHDSEGRSYRYRYLEFVALSLDGRQSRLYARGNFIKSGSAPYIMDSRQVVREKP